MTDEEMAEERATKFTDINFNEPDSYGSEKEVGHFSYYAGFLAGLKAGKEEYSKIYMLGRKDERERPCSLCSNPRSICERCKRFKKPCYGSDVGVYIGECKDFIYKEASE